MEQFYDEAYEVAHPEMEDSPHVVILGAGASLQAFPNGDKHGTQLPLMNNLVEKVELGPLLEKAGINAAGRNFEDAYSDLTQNPKLKPLQDEVEQMVYDYFSSLELPDHPTLYDHLVLSLRSKDLIASFNWDPLLLRCLYRNLRSVEKPKAVFLHGNVALGYCLRHTGSKVGQFPGVCSTCGGEFVKSRLLFPVKEKGYANDSFVKLGWDILRDYLKRAYILTIFGYSAPISDVEAVSLIEEGWGNPLLRSQEQIAIIDIECNRALSKKWSRFTPPHEPDIVKDFYESSIATHPRRTCESMRARLNDHQYLRPRALPRTEELADLWRWFAPLFQAETERES